MKKIYLSLLFAAVMLTACFSASALAAVSITPDELAKLDRITDFEQCSAMGDCDLSGEVDPEDARLALRYSVKLEKFTQKQFQRADVNSDGHVTAGDARLILRFSVGLEKRVGHTLENVEVTPATCTEYGLTVKFCTACEKIYNEHKTAPTGHTAGIWETSVPATCLSEGLAICKCIQCSETVRTDVLPKSGHDYGEWVYPNGKSCTETVNRYRECTVCGVRQNGISQPSGKHNFGWVTTVEATCTADGERVYKCLNCDLAKDKQTVAATGHKVFEWTVTKKATCAENGVKQQLCTACGKSLATQEIPKTGHDYNNAHYKVLITPTCQTEGKAYGICSNCGLSGEYILEKTDHKLLREWAAVQKLTCTDDGIFTALCEYCGELEQTVPAAGHELSWHIIKEATCSQEGQKASVCSKCGTTDSVETIEKAAHSYGEVMLPIKNATCIEAGSGFVTCKVCGDKLIKDIPPTGIHVQGDEKITIKAANCTENARIIFKCKFCDCEMPESEAEEKYTALGHKFDEWETSLAPTCTQDGTKQSFCTRCHTQALLTVKALGHTPSNTWETAEEATCSKAGLSVVRCIYCGDAVNIQVIDKKSHKTERRVKAYATCQQEGREIIVCTVCGEVTDEIIHPKTEHIPVYTVTTPPTCSSEGIATVTCSVCLKQIRNELIPKLPHTTSGTVTTDPTCTQPGELKNICTVCSTTVSTEQIPMTEHCYVSNTVTDISELSTFKWDGEKGTVLGWKGEVCKDCGKLNPGTQEQFTRLYISSPVKPVIDGRTNLNTGKIIFAFNESSAKMIDKVVYSYEGSVTSEVKPTNGIYTVTLPANVPTSATINITVIMK